MITFRRIILNSHLSALEVAKKIAFLHKPGKTSRILKGLFYYDGSRYNGSMRNGVFTTSRNLAYTRGEGIVLIKGVVKQVNSGSEISLQLGVHFILLVVFLLWVSVMALFVGISIYYRANLSSDFIRTMTLFALVGVVVMAIYRAFYLREVKRCLNDFTKEFEAINVNLKQSI